MCRIGAVLSEGFGNAARANAPLLHDDGGWDGGACLERD